MHVVTALLVDADPETDSVVREALADAGCLDIAATQSEVADASDAEVDAELVVICVHRGNVLPLRRLFAARPEVPIVAVCDEDDIDRAFVAGAMQCVTRPLRRRELLGRLRSALRIRTAERRRASRERKLSETIVALQREKQDLERLVCVDTLTGIANRRHAMDLLAAEWKRSSRDRLPLALVMIDLDCFHAYNEQYGHLGGDACLQRVADVMVRCLRRPSDFLGRYGGEEFMAVLPNTDAVGAKIVAERLRVSVEGLGIPHIGSSCSRVVTITAGFAAMRILPDDQTERLIAAADAALLHAKSHGRNRIGGDAPLVRPSRVSAQRWERYAPVYADPWFADRIPQFLELIQSEVRGVVELAREGEPYSTSGFAHMQHTADELGLAAVATLARDLEAAARDGELARLRLVSDELLQYVTHVQVVYRRATEPTAAPIARAG